MIQFLSNFFEQIGQFFSSLWSILTYAFQELLQFFRTVGAGLRFVWSIITLVPPIYLGFGIALILVLIIYLIIGRTAGGD